MEEFFEIISKAYAVELIECLHMGKRHYIEFKECILDKIGSFTPKNLYRRLEYFEEIGLIEKKEIRPRDDHHSYHPTEKVDKLYAIISGIETLKSEGSPTNGMVHKFRGNSVKVEIELPKKYRSLLEDNQKLDPIIHESGDEIIIRITNKS